MYKRNYDFRRDEMKIRKGNARPQDEGQPHLGISLLAMKDLPKSSYSLKVDPYSEANEVATLNPLLAPFNRTAGAKYGGEANIASNNVPQYAESVVSGLNDVIDVISARIKLNYRYLPLRNDDTKRGSRMVDTTKLAINEAISQLEASTYTDLAINNYAACTRMPMGSTREVANAGAISQMGDYYTDEHGMRVYTHPADVLYAFLMAYQCCLQNIVQTVSVYNKFKVSQSLMLKMNWNKQTVPLNSLFGQTNKAAFTKAIESICSNIQGEYFDNQWVKQAGLSSNLISRRSDSINDPLIEVQGYHTIPSVKMVLYTVNASGDATLSAPVFDTDHTTLCPGYTSQRGASFEAQEFNLQSHVAAFVGATSIAQTLTWSRAQSETESAVARYSFHFANRITAITDWVTYLKTSVNDLRIALDTLARTGIINWVKAYVPGVTKETSCVVTNNLLVNDIVKTACSGATAVNLDPVTERWRTFTTWNLYSGIPMNDTYQGGAFLTFCAKRISVSDDPNQMAAWIPVLYAIDRPSASTPLGVCGLVSRRGKTYELDFKEIQKPRENAALARLFPLPAQASSTIRVPYVYSGAADATAMEKSLLLKAIVQVFGYGTVDLNDVITIDPDVLYIYDFEIGNLTNMVTNYCKSSGPFKGTNQVSYDLGYDIR